MQNDLGPFGSKAHSDRIQAAGGELRFEPGMVVEHAYGGWPMQQADRRRIGFAMTRYRQLNGGSSHAWMFRAGTLGLPLIVAMAVSGSWKRCLKHAAHYGIRWYELPAALAVAAAAHAMEIPGILRALRGAQSETAGSYR